MTGLLAVKLRRDLRATWPRIVMMVVAIAVSLTVFSTVLYAWSTISRETERAYLATEPASATIRFTPAVDADQIARVSAGAAARPGVIEATGRFQLTSDVAVNGQPRDTQIQIFAAAPDDPLRLASFEVRQASWPPAAGEVFVRQDSLDLLDVVPGDTISIEAPGGAAVDLVVSGTVYDPSLAPGSQQQTGQGYLSSASLAALGVPDVFDQLKVQIADPGQDQPSRNRDRIVATAGELGRWLQAEHRLTIQEIQVPEPYAHPHQGQADALLSALLLGAGAALLLATILVANLLGGLFTQQIPQIGIMKAIGGRSGRIGRLYLAMTMVVAGAATLLALAPGLLLARALAPNLFGFLGIEPASLAAAWWSYPVVLAAGLVLPLLMALVPLVRTARTTVRAAIDHRGLGRSPRRSIGFLARLGRLPRLDRGLLMALRNTVRRPARFLLAVGLLASAGTMFVAGMSARDGAAAVASDVTDRLSWDVTVQLATPVTSGTLTPVLARVPGVTRYEGWNIAPASISGPGQLPFSRTYPDQGHGGVFLTAIPPRSTMVPPPTLRAGRWLDPGETGAIVLSQVALASAGFDAGVGDTIELVRAGDPIAWRVVGIVEERSDAGGAYVTAEGLAAATGEPPLTTTLRIVTDRHDEPSRGAVAEAVDRQLTAAGVEVASAAPVDRIEASTGGHLAPILVILLATALPMGVIGCIGLASSMAANVLERTREFGVMHAIGARPKAVRRIVVGEGILIALASCLLAAIPAVVLSRAVGSLLGNLFFDAPLPFRVSLLAAAGWTGLVVLGAWLATDAAATRAARLTVREALAYL